LKTDFVWKRFQIRQQAVVTKERQFAHESIESAPKKWKVLLATVPGTPGSPARNPWSAATTDTASSTMEFSFWSNWQSSFWFFHSRPFLPSSLSSSTFHKRPSFWRLSLNSSFWFSLPLSSLESHLHTSNHFFESFENYAEQECNVGVIFVICSELK